MSVFGKFPSSPQRFSFWGLSGFFSVPYGRTWYQSTDKNGQIWVSPNPITLTNEVASGSPLYAADLNMDGTLVFQDELANRKAGIDCPPPSSLNL